jgi:hypothetical protein
MVREAMPTLGLLAWGVLALLVVLVPVSYRIHGAFEGWSRGAKVVFEFSALRGRLAWRLAVPLAELLRRAVGSRQAGGPGDRPAAPAHGGKAKEDAVRGLTDLLLGLARKAVWRRLSWVTAVGLSDAAATALATGAVWAVKGNLAALAHGYLRFAPGQPEYDVTADFAGPGLRSRLTGIGVLRVGHIIGALPAAAANLYKLRRAGAFRGGEAGA